MDYLKLGELKLTSQQGVNAFDEKIGYTYAQHDIVSGKSILQAMGENLSEINLQISLYSYLGQNIESIMSQLDRMCLSGVPQKLVFANGVFRGDYVIKERGVTVVRTDRVGNITQAQFTLSLLEYADRVLINTKNCEQKPKTDTVNRKIETR